MANTIAEKIQELTDQVAVTEGNEASAIAYVNGVPALIQHAIDTAGTLPELQQKLTELQVRLHDSGAKVAAAIAAAPKDSEVPPVVVPPVEAGGDGTVTDPGGQA